MPRILFVSEYSGFAGGIERYMYKTAGLLRRVGFEIDGIFEHGARGQKEFESAFDRIIPWCSASEIPGEYDFAVVHKIRSGKWLNVLESRFKVVVVVHDHEYYCPRRSKYFPFSDKFCHRKYSQLFCGMCAMTRRWNCGMMNAFHTNFLDTATLWRAILNADKMVVLSNFMAEMLVTNGADSAKIEVIPPSVDVVTVSAEKSEVPHIVCAGQLIRGKGVDLLIEALKLVKNDFVADILGSGNAESAIMRQGATLGKKIRFHRWVAHPEEFWQKAAVAVLPWRWQEPFGLVGPEALAHGVPLTGFDVGGIREYLIDGVSGLLVRSNDVAGLTAALERLLSERTFAENLGKNGRELVAAKFTEEALTNGYWRIARELVSTEYTENSNKIVEKE